MTFPIRFRMSKDMLYELAASEEGSWEDAGCPKAGPHPHLVASRHQTTLEIRDAEEADQMYYALCSGTFALTEHEGGTARLRKAKQIADVLRPHAKPETVALWRQPDGM